MIFLEYKLRHTFVDSFLDDDSVVLDLGASHGEFSKFIRDNYGSNVYAVEAVTEVCDELEGKESIQAFNYCISDTNEQCEVVIPSDQHASNKVGKVEGETITVPGITLEKFIKDQGIEGADLIKMDIEGAEIEVFETISDNVLEKINQITVEFHDFLWPEMHEDVESIKRKMKSKGFYVISFSIRNNGDVLFIRKDKINTLQYLCIKYLVRYLLGIYRAFKSPNLK